MQDRYDRLFTWFLRFGFALGLFFGIYQCIYILFASVTSMPILAVYSKIDLLTIILNFIVLNMACLSVLFFPAGKYWKYVSVFIGCLGIGLCYLMHLDFYTGARYSITHSGSLWMTAYPLLLWILWGMFIPYLEKKLRKLWMYGYVGGCLLLYVIYLLPPAND